MTLLPYTSQPMLLSYHNVAFPVGIMEANSPDSILPWLCTKFTNCVFISPSPNNKFILSANDVWGVEEKIFTKETIALRKTSFGVYGWDLLDILKKSISNQCYINGNYNEKFIPHKYCYNKIDFMHDYLIVGCCDEYFYSVGYTSTGRFELFKIPIQNFIDSLIYTDEDKIHLNLFSYNKDVVPSPDMKRMMFNLEQYNLTRDKVYTTITTRYTFGIASLVRLKEFFHETSWLDKRYTLVLLEHKWIMKELIGNFLNESEREEFVGPINANYDKAKTIHMLGLKMNISPNEKYISSVSSYIDEIIATELDYFPKLISLLKEKYAADLAE